MAIPYFFPFLPLFNNHNDYLSWLVLKQGWSLYSLILRNGMYYTAGPKKRDYKSDVQVSLAWSRFTRVWSFLILPPSPLLMASFLEQNQPHGCLSHSSENPGKHTSSRLCACKRVSKQRFLRDSFEVPDWQLQNPSSSPCRSRYSSTVLSAQLQVMKAWPYFPALSQNALTTPTICFPLQSFDCYGHSVTTVTTGAATLEMASLQGKVGCVLYLLAPPSRQLWEGQVAGSCMQFPPLLQNGAHLHHCLFNEQRITQERGCASAAGLSEFPLLMLLFSKSQILPCSRILCMWLEFLGQSCLHLRTAKRKPGQGHHSCGSDP